MLLCCCRTTPGGEEGGKEATLTKALRATHQWIATASTEDEMRTRGLAACTMVIPHLARNCETLSLDRERVLEPLSVVPRYWWVVSCFTSECSTFWRDRAQHHPSFDA